MKNLILVIVTFFMGLIIFSGALTGFFNQPSSKVAGQSVEQTTPQTAQTQAPVYEIPKRLMIPKLKVNAVVESVGNDKQGKMDVPKNFNNVGWYKLGFKLGEKGSVVMAGHFDRVDGSPAVFYNVSKLIIGDEIKVTDAKGKILTYKVTRKQVYPFDQVPLQEIFASQDKARLNLITCEGTFNKKTKNYSERTVIYSELVN